MAEYAIVQDIQPDHRVLYKPVEGCETAGCHLDVWLPRSGQPASATDEGCPLAIYIHGGGFAKGSSMNIAFNQVKWWLENGMAVVSLEYRLVPHVTMKEIREDLLDAYRYIQRDLNSALDKASGGAAPHIDVENNVLAGASAGGSCVLFLAADLDRLATEQGAAGRLPTPRAVLAAYPVTDCNAMWSAPRSALEAYVRREKPHLWEETRKIYWQRVSCADLYQENVMDPNVPLEPRKLWFRAALDSKSLNSFLYAQDPPYPASLAFAPHATPSFPPTWIYCCTADTLVPVAQSYAAVDALRAHGVECVKDELDAPHGSLDLPGRYFPEQAEGWWMGHVLPSLEWARGKMRAGAGK